MLPLQILHVSSEHVVIVVKTIDQCTLACGELRNSLDKQEEGRGLRVLESMWGPYAQSGYHCKKKRRPGIVCWNTEVFLTTLIIMAPLAITFSKDVVSVLTCEQMQSLVLR